MYDTMALCFPAAREGRRDIGEPMYDTMALCFPAAREGRRDIGE
ncbi:hypothetical protein [Microcella frigidaquae]|uniref:Uncharacterized protein n=1 Tax=Microcella frigidaquae TaxID=424758 RepID=A0A840XK46_9MICO|nr:hypothetical protein [Microcella frigidaquae]MBB5618852.1 hypothetical protein [Microcella frigidaquae]